MTDSPEQRLESLGLVLPPAPSPAASYAAVRVEGSFAYVSGQGPMREGVAAYTGRLGDDLSVDEGKKSAELTMLNVLAALEAELGDLGRIKGFVKLLVLVKATPEFTEHYLVANGASDLIMRVFGPSGAHARSAIGVTSLPFSISTEIEAIVRID
jgi:enamine deaminase RidA (YjgF/YER057c/UK114 family)